MTFPAYDLNGTYHVDRITIFDNAQNRIDDLGYHDPAVEVTGTPTDATAPALVSLSASPATAITAHITDPDDGVDEMYYPYLLYKGGIYGEISVALYRVSGTPQDGMWQGTTFNLSSTGTFTATLFDARDTHGYETRITPPSALLDQGTFTLIPQPDQTPPVLHSVTVSPDTISAGGAFTVTAHLTDDLSGVSATSVPPRVSLVDPSSDYGIGSVELSLVSGTPRDGIWRGTKRVDRDLYPVYLRTYTVTNFLAFDGAGNMLNLFQAQIPADPTITIVRVTPTVASISPATGPASGGTPVTITGTNFTAGAGVSFGGVGATSVTVVNATTIIATTPAHGTGGVPMTVADTDGLSGTLANAFTSVAPAPIVNRPGTGASTPAAPGPVGRPPGTVTVETPLPLPGSR